MCLCFYVVNLDCQNNVCYETAPYSWVLYCRVWDSINGPALPVRNHANNYWSQSHAKTKKSPHNKFFTYERWLNIYPLCWHDIIICFGDQQSDNYENFLHKMGTDLNFYSYLLLDFSANWQHTENSKSKFIPINGSRSGRLDNARRGHEKKVDW